MYIDMIKNYERKKLYRARLRPLQQQCDASFTVYDMFLMFGQRKYLGYKWGQGCPNLATCYFAMLPCSGTLGYPWKRSYRKTRAPP